MGTAALLCRRRCRGAVALAGSGASLAVHPRITIGNPAVLGIVGVTSSDGPPSKQAAWQVACQLPRATGLFWGAVKI